MAQCWGRLEEFVSVWGSKSKAFTLIELMIVIAIIAILAAILVPNFVRSRARAQLTACQSNLKTIATSLEMYANDNQSNFPDVPNFNRLTPNYLKSIPVCPAAGIDTYTAGYVSDISGSASTYTACCSGLHHSGAGVMVTNYPQYNSMSGLQMP